ncbi:DeoR/GlpR family DNA-binding transcription regulator [Aquibaculum arenosum]|uniref:DeoR family transcriptional regulator n=1 Tax=Aquibaculum arenosum TaxID=3032591 RepID=A0ABT5YIH7_9PROT|nr:DeoR family transcriptional regulator [Fodinicurvata sp. CAU 1616]MDF2094740.1 DeoR family transcriptional regulator [Fodinicurvata sp. CAU 1616]
MKQAVSAEGAKNEAVLSPRRRRILELTRQRGFVSIEGLAEHFAVTPQTIRRDINALCSQDMLLRYHGGAGLPSSVENEPYPARRVKQLEEKRLIAELVTEAVPERASLFLNIGTTTEAVARSLVRRDGLRVITNNLNVAATMSENPAIEVIVAGGLVRSRDRGIVGEATIDLIGQFKVDIGIIGISGIDPDGSLLDFDYREVRVAQAIIANSRQVYLVADHSKFGRNALVRLGHLDQIDRLFTDRPPSANMRESLLAAGVKVVYPQERTEAAS